jgi:hypothetical protein
MSEPISVLSYRVNSNDYKVESKNISHMLIEYKDPIICIQNANKQICDMVYEVISRLNKKKGMLLNKVYSEKYINNDKYYILIYPESDFDLVGENLKLENFLSPKYIPELNLALSFPIEKDYCVTYIFYNYLIKLCPENKQRDAHKILIDNIRSWFNLSKPLIENLKSAFNYLINTGFITSTEVNPINTESSSWICLQHKKSGTLILLLMVDLQEENKDIKYLYTLIDYLSKIEFCKMNYNNFQVIMVGESNIDYQMAISDQFINGLKNNKNKILEINKNSFFQNILNKPKKSDIFYDYVYNEKMVNSVKYKLLNNEDTLKKNVKITDLRTRLDDYNETLKHNVLVSFDEDNLVLIVERNSMKHYMSKFKVKINQSGGNLFVKFILGF